MAFQYVCTFGILVIEVALFSLISAPLPSKYRAPLLKGLSKPFHSESVQISIKCIFGFIAVMFADSVNRVNKINSELNSRESGVLDLSQTQAGTVSRSEIQSRRFYAQRNMYLTGFCLFLSLVVYRTYSLVFELLEVKEKIKILEKENTTSTSVDDLKKQISDLGLEKEVILKKSKALHDEL